MHQSNIFPVYGYDAFFVVKLGMKWQQTSLSGQEKGMLHVINEVK